MPTYERILQGSEVLEDAVRSLDVEHRIDLEDAPPEKWATVLAKNLTIKTVRMSNVIEVTYRSRSPESAAAVVQAVVDAYLNYMQETNQGAAGQILGILNEELIKKSAELTSKRQAILEARREMLDVEMRNDNGPVHPMVKQAIEMYDSLIDAGKTRIELQSKLAAIRADVQSGRDLKQHVLGLGKELGEEMILAALGLNPADSTRLLRLEETLLKDQSELDTLRAAGLGENHPRVQRVRGRMELTQRYLADYPTRVENQLADIESQRIGPMLIDFLEQRLSELVRKEAALVQAYSQARQQAIQLVDQMGRLEFMEHEEAWLRQLQTGLLDKISRIDVAQSHGNIRTGMVDTPKVVHAHVAPKLIIVGLFSLAVGLAMGVTAVSLLDAIDDRFRSPEELQLQLDLPVLAMVGKLNLPEETGIESLQMYVAPDAVESEAFRTLRTALKFSGQETGRIVVSSTEPGDGKTTVLANLAVAFARTGVRSLLIDADMRRPGLTKLMDMRSKAGLTKILQSTTAVDELALELIRPTGVEHLDVLPSGPRLANPAELLSGPRMSELLSWAEANYDQILIDAPPAVAAADASIIASICDGLILVVRPEKNRRQHVVRAVNGFRGLNVLPLGAVINGVGTENSGGYYTYGEAYGYGHRGYGEVSDEPEVVDCEDGAKPTEQEVVAPSPVVQPPVLAAGDPPPADATLAVVPPPPPIVPRRAA